MKNKREKNEEFILSKINNNPKLIYNLPNKRLYQLLELYDKEIEKIDIEIAKIKTNN